MKTVEGSWILMRSPRLSLDFSGFDIDIIFPNWCRSCHPSHLYFCCHQDGRHPWRRWDVAFLCGRCPRFHRPRRGRRYHQGRVCQERSQKWLHIKAFEIWKLLPMNNWKPCWIVSLFNREQKHCTLMYNWQRGRQKWLNWKMKIRQNKHWIQLQEWELCVSLAVALGPLATMSILSSHINFKSFTHLSSKWLVCDCKHISTMRLCHSQSILKKGASLKIMKNDPHQEPRKVESKLFSSIPQHFLHVLRNQVQLLIFYGYDSQG